jgi:hypothetical protein
MGANGADIDFLCFCSLHGPRTIVAAAAADTRAILALFGKPLTDAAIARNRAFELARALRRRAPRWPGQLRRSPVSM